MSEMDATLFQAEGDQEQAVIQSRGGAAYEVAGYTLQTMLGMGTFGEVWAATQDRTGQKVALKLFTQPRGLDWQYFLQEIERLRDVAEHPHIVTLLDADLKHVPPYLAMPLLSGGSLGDRARSPVPEAAAWIEQMASALDYVHGKGMLHCDLKPVNVLLDAEGRARIVDFGQSIRQSDSRGSLGTMGYMAPEQVEVALGLGDDPNPRWDVYALGATAYFVLTGQAPRMPAHVRSRLESTADPSGRLKVYASVVRATPLIPVRELNPEVDRELAALVEACLAWDPEVRTKSARDVVVDLERRRQRLPLLCRKPWPPLYRAERLVARNGPLVLQFCIFLGLLVAGGAFASNSLQESLQAAQASQQKEMEQSKQSSQLERAELERRAALLRGSEEDHTPARALRPAAEVLATQSQELAPIQAALLQAEAEALRPAAERQGLKPPSFHLAWVRAVGDQVRQAEFTAGGQVAVTFWGGKAALLGTRSEELSAVWADPLVRGRKDGSVRWGSHRGQLSGAVTCLSVTEGRLAAGSSTGEVRVWEVASGRPVGAPVQIQGPVVACSAWKSQVAVVSGQGQVRVFPGSGWVRPPAPAWGVRFTPDGRQVMLDLVDGRRALGRPGSRLTAYDTLSPDGVLGVLHGLVIGTWTGKERLSLTDAGFAVFSPDGERILSGGGGHAEVRTIGGETVDLGPADAVAGVLGARTALLGGDGTVWLDGYPLLHESPVVASALSRDGRRYFTATRDGTLRMWEAGGAPGGEGDRDLPSEAVRLEAQLALGSRLEASGKAVPLSAGEWETRRAVLSQVLREHARSCQFPGAAHWRTR